MLRFVADVNQIYRSRPALWSQDTRPEGYSWIDANDSANNVLSFLRYGSDGSVLACVFNFSGAEHSRYRLGLPHAGTWREVLNSDATIYNGAGVGQLRRGRGHRRPVARPPGLGDAGATAHVGDLARTGLISSRADANAPHARRGLCVCRRTSTARWPGCAGP